ncbi:MAG: DUF2851 family protein [Bacteroidia bacterium]|nr:DUF2851 family protein [Bacteroidia bacterium]
MTEELVHHIWQFGLFEQNNLKTIQNEKIEIKKAGTYNTDAGPDFFNAKIKIGDTLWAGNVEIHINASDWDKHKHQNNLAYNNIILHVVYNADQKILRNTNTEIPTLELKNIIDQRIITNYQKIKSNKDWIPCEKEIKKTPSIIIDNIIDKLLIERIESKTKQIEENLILNKFNWEETFYQHMAKNFGFKTNAIPFELLAKSIPSTIFAKHKNSLPQIEALLFGQAGFLNDHFNDTYLLQLQNEYLFLKQKYKLQPIEKHLWKFLRLRPSNFPTIRIAQFADLIFNSVHLFSKTIEASNEIYLSELLKVKASNYWQNHYVFEKETKTKEKLLGAESINNIIINTIVPFVFMYGKHKNDDNYTQKSVSYLQNIKAEKNTIIKNWKDIGLKINTAYEAQAFIQLKNEYCSQKKCLKCSIGNYLLKNL